MLDFAGRSIYMADHGSRFGLIPVLVPLEPLQWFHRFDGTGLLRCPEKMEVGH